ncbi:MAG: hypothetical protein HYT48_03445 [Candidatus Vogelbacteria bacterium]|nr:hypothetical protein [Candidatus Vogelbacteria bacterium]
MPNGAAFELLTLGHYSELGRSPIPYLTYDGALEKMIRHQPFGWPINRANWKQGGLGVSGFARNLFWHVSTSLQVDADRDQLVFYSALGAQLDVLHGVDCFFLCRRTRVTIDVSAYLKFWPELVADFCLYPKIVEQPATQTKKFGDLVGWLLNEKLAGRLADDWRASHLYDQSEVEAGLPNRQRRPLVRI